MTTPRQDVNAGAAQLASAAAIGRRRGTWGSWGPRRRRLTAVIVGNWLATGTAIALMFVLDDLRVLLVAVGLFAVDHVLGRRLHQAERAEGAFETSDDKVVTPAEQDLLDRVQLAHDDRDVDLLVAGEWLAGDSVLERYEYPTRELLVVRSVSEAIELAGVAVVALTAPDVGGVAVGAALWILGGRSGAGAARSALGQRLYRTPVDDETRERWLAREHRVSVAVLGIALLVAVIRLI